MLIAPVRVTAPADSVVSLAEVKAHLRIDHSDDDTMLAIYRDAAILHFDGANGVLGRCLVDQQWQLGFAGFFADGIIPLRFPQVSAAVVTYADATDTDQTLSATLVRLIQTHDGSALVLKSGQTWPTTYDRPDAVRVLVTAGYGAAASDVPAPIKSAVLLRAGDLYLKREDASRPGGLVDMLIAPYCRTMMGG